MQQVQSGSDILLGSTGSFKRFESVDRSTYEGELVSALPTPPWTTDESIPPQPLRVAPLPQQQSVKKTSKNNSMVHSNVNRQQSAEPMTITSAPVQLKALPRPVPRKQLSAPAGSCQIPLINPPTESGLQKIVKDVQATTNPFINGLINFESIKSNFFSTTIEAECKIENERATKSAVISKNPFKTSTSSASSCDNNFFDFNPTTIKSIMEEVPDDGYEGDNDDIDDPLKQLEARIQKLEASNKQRRKSDSQSPPRFSPKSINKASTSPDSELIYNANEKFVDSSINGNDVSSKNFRKHLRNRSYSENEADSSLLSDQEQLSPVSAPSAIASTNPFQTSNSKRPLLKTPSETYLEQYSTMMKSNVVTSVPTVIVNNKTVQLCKHPSLTKILHTSQPTFLNEGGDSSQNVNSSIKRTISSESISSDSSVVMGTLEMLRPPVTGNLCIALLYDK
jgi:hypothetical protein